MYWLFNQKTFTIQGAQTERISWSQQRNFRGQPGDRIIFFQFRPTTKLFTYLYEIKSEVQRQIGSDNGTAITLELELQRNFNQDKEIENYIYSFPRIKNYTTRLGRHFIKKYYSLSEPEYEAIVNDQIFWPRTILGIALNAMHIDHRQAFLRYLVEGNPDILLNDFNHEVVLERFREYFHFAIEIPARQLTAAADIMRAFVEQGQFTQVAFADREENADSIANQHSIILEFLEWYNEFIRLPVYTDINSNFHNMFRGKPLPISLNA